MHHALVAHVVLDQSEVVQRQVDAVLNEYASLNRVYLVRLRDLIEFGEYDKALTLIKERLEY